MTTGLAAPVGTTKLPASSLGVFQYFSSGACRSIPTTDCLPTLKTHNDRICLLLASGQWGMLRLEDAERAQVGTVTWDADPSPLLCCVHPLYSISVSTRRNVDNHLLVRQAQRRVLQRVLYFQICLSIIAQSAAKDPCGIFKPRHQ